MLISVIVLVVCHSVSNVRVVSSAKKVEVLVEDISLFERLKLYFDSPEYFH